MIPIKLTIQGLYSYQEQQVVDFENLTQAGLFGIFGKVGSGKSSIIEAMTFALYGESERLNSRDNRAYNMMNLKSNESVLDFEFYNFQDCRYRIYRSFKRNSKKFEDVKRIDAILYKWEQNQWLPQPTLNVVEVIGLSYENFKRTIIIPQGKFKEFIELGGKDRTKMMQEIFGLDRFDLLDKVKKQAVICKTKIDQLNGQLLSYSTITPILIKEKSIQLVQQEKLVEQLNKQLLNEQKDFEALKVIQADIYTLEQKSKSLQNLLEIEPSLALQKKDLEIYEDLSRDFSAVISQVKQNARSLDQKKEAIQNTQDQLVSLQNRLEKVSQDLIVVNQSYEQLDVLKNTIQELGYVGQVCKASKELQTLELQVKKGEDQINIAKQKLSDLRIQYSDKQKELETQKKELIDSAVLMQMEAWFTSMQHISKTGKDQAKKVKVLENQIKEVEFDIKNNIVNLGSNWRDSIIQQKKQKEFLQNQLEDQLRHLKVSLQLGKYGHELKPGSPCPLCGSKQHPNINAIPYQENQKIIVEKEQEIKQLKDDYQNLLVIEAQIANLFDKRELIKQSFQYENTILNNLRLELTALLKNYIWREYCDNNIESFSGFKQAVDKKKLLVNETEKCLSDLITQGEAAKSAVDIAIGSLSEIQMNHARVSSDLQANTKWIKTLDVSAYLDKSEHQIKQEILQGSDNITQIELRYKQLTQTKQELCVELSGVQMQKKNLTKDIQELDVFRLELNKTVAELLQKHKLINIKEVQDIIEKDLDVRALREEIQNFYINLELLKTQIKEVSHRIPQEKFDVDNFEKKQELVKHLENSLQEKKSFVAVLQTEKKRLEQDYALKVELQQEFEVYDSRLKNIQILDNMFKAAGFVNYVSGIYLDNLCKMANIRFHRLTNNQLSLQLNSANEFEILDYLNDGKPRSVKTLSGGQIFQVSLSLALALAESVQSLSKSDKNFFFIDEGFGTQDSESVNMVFETLQNLQKENRIVGIISHVDELQDRIPLSVTVIKDPHKGSIIVDSF